MAKTHRPHRHVLVFQPAYAAIEDVLRKVDPKQYDHFRSTDVATGWRYVVKNGRWYVGRRRGVPNTTSWADPALCAAELFLLSTPAHPLYTAYQQAMQVLEAQAGQPLPVVPPQPSLPGISDLKRAHKETMDELHRARAEGRHAEADQLVKGLITITAAMNPHDQEALRAATALKPEASPPPPPSTPHKPTLLTVVSTPAVLAPTTPSALAPTPTPADDAQTATIHEEATQAARQEYLHVLSGRDTNLKARFPGLRVSVDYAVLRGIMAYWSRWIAITVGSIDVPFTESVTLEDPRIAAEARRLLIQGIPCDFLFYEVTHKALYDIADTNGAPMTGMVVTPNEAAFLSLLRPPTWLQAWAPLADPPDADQCAPALSDYFFGYDPIASQAQGQPMPLAIPKHMTNDRYPVLTVADAFLVWGLACARKLTPAMYLPRQEAANRVGEYTKGQVEQVFGVPTAQHSNKMLHNHYQMRRDAGQPEDEILADLGPEPTHLEDPPNWIDHSRQLRAAAIQAVPTLVPYAVLAERIHQRPKFAQLDLLAEIQDDSAPLELPAPTSAPDVAPEAAPPDWVPDDLPWGA